MEKVPKTLAGCHVQIKGRILMERGGGQSSEWHDKTGEECRKQSVVSCTTEIRFFVLRTMENHWNI